MFVPIDINNLIIDKALHLRCGTELELNILT